MRILLDTSVLVAAVSNTSPVLNLAAVGQLSVLGEPFGEIWIPPTVIEELQVEEDLPGSHGVRQAIDVGWLRVAEVENQTLVKEIVTFAEVEKFMARQ